MKHKPDRWVTLAELQAGTKRKCVRCGRDADGPTKCARFAWRFSDGTQPKRLAKSFHRVTSITGGKGSPLAWRP